jgi:four helix bundle protein
MGRRAICSLQPPASSLPPLSKTGGGILNAMRDHSKLRAFELADQLAVLVYEHSRDFPRPEQFGLTSQMRRVAVPVPSNIVEGCARDSLADYIRFLDIAYGSARELEYQISLAHHLAFLSDDSYSILRSKAEETCKVLNGLIRSLRGKKPTSSGLQPPA